MATSGDFGGHQRLPQMATSGDFLTATDIVEAIACWTSSQGAVRLVLAVRQANLHAVALYERQGFRDVGWASASGEPFPERRMMLTVS